MEAPPWDGWMRLWAGSWLVAADRSWSWYLGSHDLGLDLPEGTASPVALAGWLWEIVSTLLQRTQLQVQEGHVRFSRKPHPSFWGTSASSDPRSQALAT